MTYQPRPCTSCGGSRGRVVTVSDGRTTRQQWQNCAACGGRGVR